MMGQLAKVLAKAKQVAVEYYRLTGKPLGITGEVGEYEAARLLTLELAEARTPDYDATGKDGTRYQIKSRSFPTTKSSGGQRIGAIKSEHGWNMALLVLMNENLETQEIWAARKEAIQQALNKPGSKSRNERRTLAVSQFKRIGTRVWPKDT